MTPSRSPLRELHLVRPRVRAALAALLALALVVAAPFLYEGSASAKKAPTAKAKTRAKAKTKTGASGRRATRPRSAGDRSGQRPAKKGSGDVQAEAPAAKTKHKPAAAEGQTAPTGQGDETENRPAREKAAGSTTPSPAGAGGGGSDRPKLPQPAHTSAGASATSSPAPSTAQPTTSAGTVPTRPLPVNAPRRQRGSRRAAERRAAVPRRARAIAGDSAALDAPPLLALSSIRPAGSRPSRTARPAERKERADDDRGAPVIRTVRDIVEVVPAPVQRLLLALAGLTTLLGVGYLLVAARARRLERQRGDLLQEVGLLQAALLPPVPSRLGAVATSVAYRPSDGPAAGGDFYDALMLSGGRAAFILGDVSGHGRPALARTAFVRYTLRAYLEAGLEPRIALQVAGRVVDEHLGGDFATVLVAIHDPSTGSLTYASAGHPAPLVLGTMRTEPVLAASSPPIGLGMRTGLRQTSLPLPSGSLACLYTDGLTEARTEGGILGRPRLGDLVEDLGPDATAVEVLDAVANEARLVSDDMAAVLLSPTAGVTAGGFRTEQLEIDEAEAEAGLAERFLDACGADLLRMDAAVRELRQLCDQHGGAVLHVRFGIRGPRIEVVPRNVESLEAASRRALALAR